MKRNYRIFILIAIPVILFNLSSVFQLEVMLNDDAHSYYALNEGLFPSWLSHSGLVLRSFVRLFFWYLQSLSLELTKLFQLLFIMVPLSFMLYYLFRYKFGLPNIVSYTSAVLPQILPSQSAIPASIVDQYSVLGLLLISACFLCGFKYLESPQHEGRVMLLISVLLYATAILYMEQSVFFFPIIVFAFLGYTKLNKKQLHLIIACLPSFLYGLFMTLAQPRNTAVPSLQSMETILYRLEYYFAFLLPFPTSSESRISLLALACVAVLIAGFVSQLRRKPPSFDFLKSYTHLSPALRVFYGYGFFSLWAICNFYAFIALSSWIAPRYAYIAGFGLTALLAIASYSLIRSLTSNDRVISIFFVALILFSGISRHTELNLFFTRANEIQVSLASELSRYEFPPNAQIIVLFSEDKLIRSFYRGTWPNSSGHLKYILKRKDIAGIIYDDTENRHHFIDPFNPEERWEREEARMRGIDLEKPLFLSVDGGKSFIQYSYALQWKGSPPEKRAEREIPEWTIYQIDKESGLVSPFKNGKGYDAYLATLKSLELLDIHQKDIFWGGIPLSNPR